VSPRELNHFGQRRSATISANLAPDYSLGEALVFMDQAAARVLKPGYTTDLNGTSREFRKLAGRAWAWSSCWRWCSSSWCWPRSSRALWTRWSSCSVPLSMIGALLALAMEWGLAQCVFSQIGLITLVGLITKHGILIVEFTNQLREEGMAMVDALVKASAQRLRPILMTTGAMVLGAVPLALATGARGRKPPQIGWVIVGGMSLGTLLTIFVVPTMYTLLARRRIPGPIKGSGRQAAHPPAHH
jgi:multidrug efflux pump